MNGNRTIIRPRRLHAGSAVAGIVLAAGLAVTPAHADPSAPPPVVELTIADIEALLADGTSCRSIVEAHLARIVAYDDAAAELAVLIDASDRAPLGLGERVEAELEGDGVDLQAVISVAPDALATADALDEAYAAGGPVGPLHCVPVLLKDNVDALGTKTTAGATALADATPPDDAFLTQVTRAAGAVILGKTNLDEFAFGFTGSSSIEGLTRNPYDPQRGAGGSSSGTGAAIAASFGVLGIGTDTGGSIRVPSSVQGLVGIRPSMRLISQDGIVPLSHFQDTAGPMCRTVDDCARYLSVLSAFDAGPYSGQNTLPLQRDDRAVLLPDADAYDVMLGGQAELDYAAAIDGDLEGVRIGVVRALFGSNAEVVGAMERAIARFEDEGAVVADVSIPELSTVTSYSSMSSYEFRDHLTEYLMSWPSTQDLHPQTYEQVAASASYEADSIVSFSLNARGAARYTDPTYEANTLERPEVVRTRVLAAFDNVDLAGTPQVPGVDSFDVLLYPSVLTPPRVGGAPSTGSNNRLSPFTGFPALTMPAGFTQATADTPALPIGMELLGREFDERTLLDVALGYETAVAGTPDARSAPTYTPELPQD